MSSISKIRKLGLQTRSGNTINTISLSASSSLNTNYNLTLPPALPTVGLQALFVDTTGVLSWNATLNTGVTNSFAGASGVISATSVTGLVLNTTSYATANVFVSINATTNQTAVYNLTTTLNAAGTYTLTYYSQGDDTGIVFSVNSSSGQISYTSPVIAGFTALSMSWVTPKVIANFVTSSFATVSIQVTVYATNNLTQVVDLKVYSKSGANNYALVQTNDGDDTGIVFSVVTGTGQVQYTSPTFSGWTATTMQWVNPPTLTTTPTVLSSLSISSGTFQVTNGSTTLGTTSGGTLSTAVLSSTTGSILTIPSGTIQDTATAASGTLTNYSSLFIGVPTLSAVNTGVITTTASTVTIAGPPTAGTNETITNTYALNVASGSSRLNGNVVIGGSTAANAVTLSTLNGRAVNYAQYGTVSLGSSGQANVSFPTAFTNQPNVTLTYNGSGGNKLFSLTVLNVTTTGFTATGNYLVSGSATVTALPDSIYWQAIGS